MIVIGLMVLAYAVFFMLMAFLECLDKIQGAHHDEKYQKLLSKLGLDFLAPPRYNNRKDVLTTITEKEKNDWY
jgi:hypothetical protein